ncbi:hypothetical protein STRIP9103_08652 [Streptomyces ipomoeae 91-03]|uniref:Uncharacterized protein n=1 Tax=Streptomyces ipomoeae 91-03 TaxID=698759 RepID=L1L5H8_9ACTN|nr:hypothetical protein STRIP9103_08652 [Streptomyces ipomoeae 91-03]
MSPRDRTLYEEVRAEAGTRPFSLPAAAVCASLMPVRPSHGFAWI